MILGDLFMGIFNGGKRVYSDLEDSIFASQVGTMKDIAGTVVSRNKLPRGTDYSDIHVFKPVEQFADHPDPYKAKSDALDKKMSEHPGMKDKRLRDIHIAEYRLMSQDLENSEAMTIKKKNQPRDPIVGEFTRGEKDGVRSAPTASTDSTAPTVSPESKINNKKNVGGNVFLDSNPYYTSPAYPGYTGYPGYSKSASRNTQDENLFTRNSNPSTGTALATMATNPHSVDGYKNFWTPKSKSTVGLGLVGGSAIGAGLYISSSNNQRR